MGEKQRIAVLTSGGDAPGMNAAIRAVVRSGIAHGREMLGLRHGYTGLIDGDAVPLDARAVGGIIDRGGTMLGTSRCERLRSAEGCAAAIRQIHLLGLEALIIIGGNGSHAGALSLAQRGAPVVTIASTIDNDLPCSDVTIGATTAVDTAVEAIDRLRVTASAHGRVFLVEVMGRNTGHLALAAGIAGGAEAISVPEISVEAEQIAAQILGAYERGKSHAIVVVAEGARDDADALAEHFRSHHERLGFELRVTKLGHVQRGGSPGAFDRMLGSELGAAAVEHAVRGELGVSIGMVRGRIAATPLTTVVGTTRPLDRRLYDLAQTLAR